MSNLVTRLNGHFAAMAAVGAVAAIGGVAQNAEAAVVYSGVLNTNIPNTIDGLYVNFVTGAATTPAPNAGYDINPYNSGSWNMFEGTGCTEIGSGTTFTALSAGTPIDGTGAYINGSIFPAAFGTTAILGVRFLRESDSATLFGWVRLTLPGSPFATTGAGTLVDYAYEDTGAGINAGATIPAPTAGMAVLALGGLGLLGRRRKN